MLFSYKNIFLNSFIYTFLVRTNGYIREDNLDINERIEKQPVYRVNFQFLRNPALRRKILFPEDKIRPELFDKFRLAQLFKVKIHIIVDNFL